MPEVEPQVNEVWETNSGNLALVVAGPPRYDEIEGVTPPGAAYFPIVYPRRREPVHNCGMLMLSHSQRDGWQVSEIMMRLKKKTDLKPWEFFSGVTKGEQMNALNYHEYLLKQKTPAEPVTAE